MDLLVDSLPTLQQVEQDLSRLLSSMPPPSAVDPSPPSSAEQPATKRMKSCQACRLRRVKCERVGTSKDCTSCISRGFECKPMPKAIPKKTAATREGKRIVQARALFGGGADAGQSNTDPHGDDFLELQTIGTSQSNSPPDSYIFPSSTASWISAMELQGAVAGSLLDAYFTNLPTIAFVEDTGFRLSFENAGRRLVQMDDQSQVLCATILAIGARVSDHPLLVGQGAPRIADLGKAASLGIDLSEFGARREAMCRQLAAHAIKLVDEKATLRIASVESIGALMLVEALLDADDVSLQKSRPYVSAMNGHARALLGEPGITPEARSRLSGSVLGWTAYVRDATWAANSGSAPMFSEDDLFLLREHEDRDVPLAQVLRMPPARDPIQSFWSLTVSWMHAVTNIARDASVKLTGIRARSAERINEEFVADYLARMDMAFSAVPEIDRRARFFDALPQGRVGQNVGTVIRSLKITMYNMAFLLDRVVSQRTSARWREHLFPRATIAELDTWPSIAGPSDDEAYWARLLALKAQTAPRALKAARGVAQVLGGAVDSGVPIGTHECMDIRGTLMLFSRLPIWAAMITNAPTYEEGGEPDFDYETKLKELRGLLKALYSVAWAHSNLAAPVEWIKDEIRNVEQRQATHLVNLGTLNTTFAPAPLPFLPQAHLNIGFMPSSFTPTGSWGEEEINAMLRGLEQDLGATAVAPTLDFTGASTNGWLYDL